MGIIKNGHFFWCLLVEPCHCKTAGYVIVALIALATGSLEASYGWESLSVALLADAWHVFSDAVVYAIAIWGNIAAVRGLADIQEVKNKWAVRNANVLIAVAFVTMALAVKRMIHPEEIFTEQMLFAASVGLAANGVMYIVLNELRMKHEHAGREHGHHDDGRKRDRLHDTAVWHTISDSLLSLVVTSIGYARWKSPAFETYNWVDPLVSLVICAGLIFVATRMKREIRGQTTEHRVAITRNISFDFRF